jgi:hypothetical protein
MGGIWVTSKEMINEQHPRCNHQVAARSYRITIRRLFTYYLRKRAATRQELDHESIITPLMPTGTHIAIENTLTLQLGAAMTVCLAINLCLSERSYICRPMQSWGVHNPPFQIPVASLGPTDTLDTWLQSVHASNWLRCYGLESVGAL